MQPSQVGHLGLLLSYPIRTDLVGLPHLFFVLRTISRPFACLLFEYLSAVVLESGPGGPHAAMFVVGFLASVSWGTQVTRPRPPCLPGSCQKAELGTLLARAGDSSVVLTVSACDPVRRFLKQNPPL